mmetsp:Transcript_111234/g.214361  ORF Transcript_111234/g.214361 Transcript_111234/m.214361 type:complete len:195 (+) Transcript_111234:81-665(+)
MRIVYRGLSPAQKLPPSPLISPASNDCIANLTSNHSRLEFLKYLCIKAEMFAEFLNSKIITLDFSCLAPDYGRLEMFAQLPQECQRSRHQPLDKRGGHSAFYEKILAEWLCQTSPSDKRPPRGSGSRIEAETPHCCRAEIRCCQATSSRRLPGIGATKSCTPVGVDFCAVPAICLQQCLQQCLYIRDPDLRCPP